ncbi:MAG: enoyl-CoA hydratase/isomerase family protein, partial [Promicromonosporaceae bacterium]|nr:enoyl-CoA hydratase/isomerase family protein [Promicromonosporaceae bacterium]
LLVLTGPGHHTFATSSLEELGAAFAAQERRARAGEIAGLAITGKGRVFSTGADLGALGAITSYSEAYDFARLGQTVFNQLRDFSVPTFALLNGSALGGGLELALAADFRLSLGGAGVIGLPEVGLGIIPGWGACQDLPQIVGLGAAIDLAITRPLSGRPYLTMKQAHELGLIDERIPIESGHSWTASLTERIDYSRNGAHNRGNRYALRVGSLNGKQGDDAASAGANSAIAEYRERLLRSGFSDDDAAAVALRLLEIGKSIPRADADLLAAEALAQLIASGKAMTPTVSGEGQSLSNRY